METQALSSKINYLIGIAKNDKLGYANSANETEDATLKKILLRLSAERDGYVSQLQGELHNMGAEEEENGGNIGITLRTWKDLKKALIAHNSEAIIKEFTTGEEFALKEYEAILENIKTDSALSKVLIGQRNGITSALNGITIYLSK